MEPLLAANSISQRSFLMTSLRERMTEDMRLRNLALKTQVDYIRQVSLFARYFKKSPELLGPGHIRKYQVYMVQEKQLAPGSIQNAIAALRFLYSQRLKHAAIRTCRRSEHNAYPCSLTHLANEPI